MQFIIYSKVAVHLVREASSAFAPAAPDVPSDVALSGVLLSPSSRKESPNFAPAAPGVPSDVPLSPSSRRESPSSRKVSPGLRKAFAERPLRGGGGGGTKAGVDGGGEGVKSASSSAVAAEPAAVREQVFEVCAGEQVCV